MAAEFFKNTSLFCGMTYELMNFAWLKNSWLCLMRRTTDAK
jgi:hypothetical protein